MDLSILIVNWNTRDLLAECLASVYEHWSHIDLEVIVIDNASSDGSVEMVRKSFPQVRLIENAENHGFVVANNQGVNAARGRYLLLLNSDTRVLDNGVGKMLSLLDSNSDIGILTGRMLNQDGSFQRPFRRKPHLLGAFMRHSVRLIMGFNTPLHRRYRMEDVGPDEQIDVDWIIGAYIFLRRDLLEDGKVFDEDIFMYYEDALLCFRCWQKGFRVTYAPFAPIVHYGGVSAKQVRAFTAYHSFKSSVVYFRKTRGRVAALVYEKAVRGVWVVLYGIFRLMNLLAAGVVQRKTAYFKELLSMSEAGSG